MRITILPKTRLGWWSVGLVVVSIIFFVLFQVILGPGPDYNMALANALTVVIAGVSAAAFVTGFISIMNGKERPVLILLVMLIGLYTLIGSITGLLGLQK